MREHKYLTKCEEHRFKPWITSKAKTNWAVPRVFCQTIVVRTFSRRQSRRWELGLVPMRDNILEVYSVGGRIKTVELGDFEFNKRRREVVNLQIAHVEDYSIVKAGQPHTASSENLRNYRAKVFSKGGNDVRLPTRQVTSSEGSIPDRVIGQHDFVWGAAWGVEREGYITSQRANALRDEMIRARDESLRVSYEMEHFYHEEWLELTD